MQDMEDHFKSREADLKDDVLVKAREIVSLKREVEEGRLVLDKEGRRTKEQADDLLMQVRDMAAQRDDLVGARARMQKELDEAHLQLRLADHRAQAAETRGSSMEKELAHTKVRNLDPLYKNLCVP
jgi:chromosome segregation ATPase